MVRRPNCWQATPRSPGQPAPAADGSVVQISGRERVALGNVTHKSAYGFVWQAQKVIGRGAGARVLVRVLDPKTHQSVRLKIRLRDWRKITKFLAMKVDRLLDAATQAADLITAGAQDEQGGKSPGSSNPGPAPGRNRTKTTRRTARRRRAASAPPRAVVCVRR